MKFSEGTICYLCGKVNPDSRDHIPPKNIFLEGASDLITVPAHRECNKEYEQDDEYFRIALSIATFPESGQMRKLWKDKILHGIHRPEAQRFKNYILNHIQPAKVVQNGIVASNCEVFLADADRLRKVLSRIARGIIYKDTHALVPISSKIEVELMGPEVRSRRGTGFHSIGNDVFKYSWHSRENIFYLWFIFYECVDVWITVDRTATEDCKSC